MKLLQEFEDPFENETAFTEAWRWSYDKGYFWDVAGVKVVENYVSIESPPG